jgi:hypothetical protein
MGESRGVEGGARVPASREEIDQSIEVSRGVAVVAGRVGGRASGEQLLVVELLQLEIADDVGGIEADLLRRSILRDGGATRRARCHRRPQSQNARSTNERHPQLSLTIDVRRQ